MRESNLPTLHTDEYLQSIKCMESKNPGLPDKQRLRLKKVEGRVPPFSRVTSLLS